MAGHSKWAQIKHKKAQTDARKGKVFAKTVREISVATKLGGRDSGKNPRLRSAIERAKEVNMPYENIKRAMMKGAGELPGTTYEEVIYEGYGPGGAAILIEVLTDNKKRSVSEARHILSKNGGSLGEVGCVSWMFEKKGYILVEKLRIDEDTLMSGVIEAGAEEMINDPKEDNYEIITSPEDLDRAKEVIEKQGIPVAIAEITMLPKSYVQLEGRAVEQMIRLIEALEDNDDVQNVYTNFDMPEEAMALR
ncbi:YebC/PmpR family DNA-binding transcriptional regulator [Thermodesulfovibrionales bacterium]|nr:YebC/PmpR family DNA-binding transcriptional regulator [Thermodesulfovibrionales bacterium]MCL0083839.1 YebC/PmpR family DNA-binding transcriptional regulator [Thermodesulfovibrionales bacterium]MCL0086372.1 YebC/PmpR family DNA-binding transcriptional regulator [Thermodesulfovibrionales bacterium]MCL0107320.1 YebC/PmpR family DNA-binding transcriptional regulator [Thermodesulfovibrionales bacterium]